MHRLRNYSSKVKGKRGMKDKQTYIFTLHLSIPLFIYLFTFDIRPSNNWNIDINIAYTVLSIIWGFQCLSVFYILYFGAD